ncbi:hypothetical protein [Streptoalloteichus tenebrarius]|uniref:hypothetical protein n=1 Tax=Streptoalloteichus tenebrarius (strain ATCC 17920 / DSM 40477 / JCM 4838 / CBS 697.72 / NBRC 16177 / NCIMB 11028 / NRRL B-12390 / A12253. 1 / ISP 5477) TaxID=1933 RepID=UPI0020A52A0C|nr:hypothetical protein [Streptoalloteichus tenebrarius]BFF02144.1 hypothetical protein GCM10020241_38190 [Streptoalloteichus tenebrarius]
MRQHPDRRPEALPLPQTAERRAGRLADQGAQPRRGEGHLRRERVQPVDVRAAREDVCHACIDRGDGAEDASQFGPQGRQVRLLPQGVEQPAHGALIKT